MTHPPTPVDPLPLDDGRLLEVLNDRLEDPRLRGRVVSLQRSPAPYYSSHRLEEVTVVNDDGRSLVLMLKDLGPDALREDARRAKPSFLRSPTRELWAYDILEGLELAAPRCLGSYSEPEAGIDFLILEKAPGVPLWQVGDFRAWEAAGRWIAGAHERLAPVADFHNPDPLLVYNRGYFEIWPQRVKEFVLGRGGVDDARVRALACVVANYGAVVEKLAGLPATIIHGEYHASNILVEATPAGPRIHPVDWEMAGVGPGLLDLADLTAGNWTEAQRAALVDAYRGALPPGWAAPEEGYEVSLDACRLHKAMQWLGWAADWSPPREHKQDWLAEALRLATKLKLIPAT